jgi:hypothetical protein
MILQQCIQDLHCIGIQSGWSKDPCSPNDNSALIQRSDNITGLLDAILWARDSEAGFEHKMDESARGRK